MRRLFRNFDFVASAYPVLEFASFGNVLNEARDAFLRRTARAPHVLLIGEGNGRFLAKLLARKRGGSVTVIDSSPKMLRLLAKRIAGIRRYTELKLVDADFLLWSGKQASFDAIVTHFFLDLFRPQSQLRVVGKITEVAKPEALWIDVDYRVTKTKLRHRVLDWLQYRFDETFSGVEADRHYDPFDHIRASGWFVGEERLFCSGRVSAQALMKAPKPELTSLVPAMPQTLSAVSTIKLTDLSRFFRGNPSVPSPKNSARSIGRKEIREMKRPRNKCKPPKLVRPGKQPPGWQATPRQIRLALLIGGAVFVSILGSIVVFSLPHRLTQEERALIGHYDSVRAALSLDDLPAARTAAASLVGSVSHGEKKISDAAIALSRAESLPAARDAFQAMSARVIKLASGNAGYYRMGCSMAGCPAPCEPCDTMKYGEWIQTSALVQNPFMGKAHPNCGMLK